MRVLVIEDSSPIRKSVVQGLREAGYAVDEAGDGQQGLWLAKSGEHDVIVLDLMLPKVDGLAVLKSLRRARCPAHVIVLTARDAPEDRVAGLELGADDYLVKPFHFAELLARVEALVRRKYEAKSTTLTVGDLVVDLAGRVVRRGGQRIDLGGEIEALSEKDLSRRLATEAVPEELRPVVAKLNGLLSRLAEAFARERAFAADVAHELRTPLAGLRSTLEVCRSRRREPEAYETALDESRAITDRMEGMVQSLLLLARSDAGQVAVERRRSDLCAVVRATWSHLEYQAQRRGLKVAMELPPECWALTDADKLRLVLHNLLENAVSYANEGGFIRVAVRETQVSLIEIANSGSQIAAEDSGRLFERFWRGDAARGDDGLHCGLGLSLSRKLVELLGGEISILTMKGGEFVARVGIPVAAELS